MGVGDTGSIALQGQFCFLTEGKLLVVVTCSFKSSEVFECWRE